MRKLASIVEIASCNPIPDTDRLSVATMVGKGWNIVTARDEYKPGDMAVYFEIDSFLPADDERYAFLKERCLRKFVSKSGQVLREGIRIKTIKLRGVISQGLLMPIGVFPELNELLKEICPDDGAIRGLERGEDGKNILVTKSADGSTLIGVEEARIVKGVDTYLSDLIGKDVSTLLKVEHFDEVKEQLAPACGSNPISADAMGRFPSDFIPKTDEERCQNLGDWWDKFKGMKWEVSSKDDGSSFTMFYSPMVDAEVPFGVCSRNLRLKPVDAKGGVPLGYQMAAKYNVQEKLKAYTEKTGIELALQGELVGPGIQKDRDKYLEHEWHVFKVWDITNQQFLLPKERRELCIQLDIPHVEIVAEELDVFSEFPTCESLLKFAEGKTARGNEREGLVFKSTTERGLSFKAVSNKYLLKSE